MSLYDEKGNWTPEALNICAEIKEFLVPILEKSLNNGMSHSDFCYMVNSEIEAIILANRRLKKKASSTIERNGWKEVK